MTSPPRKVDPYGTGTQSDHFESVSPTWLARYRTHSSFHVRMKALEILIRSEIQGVASPWVLDYGSGPGVFSAIATRYGCHAVAIDSAPAMLLGGVEQRVTNCDHALEELVQYCEPAKIIRVAGTVDCLMSSQSPTFNLVLIISVLEYISDPGRLVRRLAEFLIPGGAMIITVPNSRSPVRALERPINALVDAAGARLYGQRRFNSYLRARPHGSRVPWRARCR